MKASYLILGAAWILTVVGAYHLGGGGSPDPGPGEAAAVLPAKSDRDAEPATASGGAPAVSSRMAGSSPGVEVVTTRTPRRAVVELANLADPLARAEGFIALAESLRADQFRDVVDDFRSLGITTERMSEYAILLHAWGKADPEGALDYAFKNTGTNFARRTVLASWAGYDPDAAIAFARERGEEGKPNGLLVGVISGIAPNDLARATDLLGSLPRSEVRGEGLQAMLPLILKDGIDGALAWTDTISDGVLRQGAVTYIAERVAEEDPRQAADLVLALPDKEFQLRALDDIAEAWAETDIDGALAWAESLEPDLRAEAADGIVDELASADPARAAEWLESIAATTDVDPAIRSFVRATAYKDPALAVAWTTEISNDRDRERSFHMIMGHWMRTEPEVARAWIDGNPQQVPESIKRRFDPDRDR